MPFEILIWTSQENVIVDVLTKRSRQLVVADTLKHGKAEKTPDGPGHESWNHLEQEGANLCIFFEASLQKSVAWAKGKLAQQTQRFSNEGRPTPSQMSVAYVVP